MKVNYVVVDSGPIIKGAILEKFSKHAICPPGVIKEIKDLKTRERMRNLPPYFFSVKSPSDKAINHVISVSKETGDLKVLSKVDIEVLALAYEMQYLKTSEQVEDMFEKLELDSDDNDSDNNDDDDDDTKNTNDNHFNRGSDEESLNITDSEDEDLSQHEEQGEDEDEDDLENKMNNLEIQTNNDTENNDDIKTIYTNLADNDGWVTAENVDLLDDSGFGFGSKYSEASDKVPIEELEVIPMIGCLTTDYAMQNVLFKMNITILSVNGMVIKEPRIFVSFCRSCFRNFRRVDIYFCPHCGNDSLGKVPAKIQENGEIELFMKKNFKPNLRNTKFSIPNPTGGKHRDGNFYIYCADQKIPMEKAKKSKYKFDSSESGAIPFSTHDVTARSTVLGINEHRQGNLKPSRPMGNRNSKFKK